MMHDSSTSRDQLLLVVLHGTTAGGPFLVSLASSRAGDVLTWSLGECVSTGDEHTTASCARHTMHGTTTEWHYGTPTLVWG